MTLRTLRDLVNSAFRENGATPAGESPEYENFDEGLDKLLLIFDHVLTNWIGTNFSTLSYGTEGMTNSYAKAYDRASEIDSSYVPENTKLMCNLSTTKTVYLPPAPNDGARFSVLDVQGNFSTNNLIVNGNGRQIENTASITLSTDNLNREWFYRKDLGNWVRVTDLDADSTSPFPKEFDDLFITMLSIRLTPRNGIPTATETVQTMREAMRAFKSRYTSKKFLQSEEGLLRLRSNRGYGLGTSIDPTVNFSLGLVR